MYDHENTGAGGKTKPNEFKNAGRQNRYLFTTDGTLLIEYSLKQQRESSHPICKIFFCAWHLSQLVGDPTS